MEEYHRLRKKEKPKNFKDTCRKANDLRAQRNSDLKIRTITHLGLQVGLEMDCFAVELKTSLCLPEGDYKVNIKQVTRKEVKKASSRIKVQFKLRTMCIR